MVLKCKRCSDRNAVLLERFAYLLNSLVVHLRLILDLALQRHCSSQELQECRRMLLRHPFEITYEPARAIRSVHRQLVSNVLRREPRRLAQYPRHDVPRALRPATATLWLIHFAEALPLDTPSTGLRTAR